MDQRPKTPARYHCDVCPIRTCTAELTAEELLYMVTTNPDALQCALRLLAGLQRDVAGLEERVVAALEERAKVSIGN